MNHANVQCFSPMYELEYQTFVQCFQSNKLFAFLKLCLVLPINL